MGGCVWCVRSASVGISVAAAVDVGASQHRDGVLHKLLKRHKPADGQFVVAHPSIRRERERAHVFDDLQDSKHRRHHRHNTPHAAHDQESKNQDKQATPFGTLRCNGRYTRGGAAVAARAWVIV